MNQATTELDQELINAFKQILLTNNGGIQWTDLRDKQKLTDIVSNYAKLKNIIQSNWRSESVLQVHPETKMYLDGSLSFLDPYIKELTDAIIPHSIHQRYRWIDTYLNVKKIDENDKNSTLVTQDMVQAVLAERKNEAHLNTKDLKYLLKVVESSVTECLNKIKNNEGNSRFKGGDIGIICARQADQDFGDISQHNMFTYTIKVDEINDQLENSDNYFENTNINSVNDNIEIVMNKDENNKASKKLAIQSGDFDAKEDNLNKYDEETDITMKIKSEEKEKCNLEPDLKSFFNDLAENVPGMLSLEKQKELQQRVILVLNELLERND